MPRYLTKSRFKLGLECSAKLYYTKKAEYADSKINDPFMAALAEGGFQVGELAKIYFEGGHDIDDLDYENSLAKTIDLLKHENVTIYEAAFRFGNLFIRADIIRKTANKIELIEVKAKSYDGEDGFMNVKTPTIKAAWEPYLFDIAFQYYVVSKAMPGYLVVPFLMLADKSATATVEGLNQFFRIQREGARVKAAVHPGLTKHMTGAPVLINIPVVDIVHEILQDKHTSVPFEQLISDFATSYEKDVFLPQPLGKKCGACEFRASDLQIADGIKSGFHECWTKLARFTPEDFNTPSVLDIWNYRGKDECISNGIYFQRQLSRTDFEPKTKNSKSIIGLTQADRKTMQIEKSKNGDKSYFLDVAEISVEINACTYPLHFIDFETTAVALPFNKGRRPYEQTAFQFSHHIITKDGTIKHAGQWINAQQGKFPNFDFIRALKDELDNDNGSVFRYAAHENSILNAIHSQLQLSSESDKDSLCEFIRKISHSKGGSNEKWTGSRDMIDLRDWVLKYYYSPATKGSNSIKDILPAILNESKLLKEKYNKPIYGTSIIESINFKNHIWINFDKNDQLINPYHTLANIHDGFSNESLDFLMTDEEAGIADGGAAMTAYAKMQFSEMSNEERNRITEALFRYCELDTMAMVMIWEAWREWCKQI